MSGMSESTQETTIPEAIENEDGDAHWLLGHVEPTLAVLAAVTSAMLNVGPEAAQDLLVGGGIYQDEYGGKWTYEDQRRWANELLGRVEHIWLTPDPENEENMLPCAPDFPGAEAWTKLDMT